MKYEIPYEDFLAFNEILPPALKMGYEDSGKIFLDHSSLRPEVLEYWDPACYAVRGTSLEEYLSALPATCECTDEVRRAVLARTDYVLLPDSPFPEGDREVIVVFRQALRDLNEEPSWPRITWPLSGVAKIDAILNEELEKRGLTR